MSNLLDEIVSEANEKSNNFKSFTVNELQNQPYHQEVNANFPKIMEPYISHKVPSKPEPRKWEEETYLSQINNAFTKLKQGADSDKLSDTFCSEDNQIIKDKSFSTKRSFKKTVNSFYKYYSCIQASS